MQAVRLGAKDEISHDFTGLRPHPVQFSLDRDPLTPELTVEAGAHLQGIVRIGRHVDNPLGADGVERQRRGDGRGGVGAAVGQALSGGLDPVRCASSQGPAGEDQLIVFDEGWRRALPAGVAGRA